MVARDEEHPERGVELCERRGIPENVLGAIVHDVAGDRDEVRVRPAHRFRDLADATKNVDKQKSLRKLANDVGAFGVAVDTALLTKVIPDFEKFSQNP